MSETDPATPEPFDATADLRGRGVRVEGYEGLRAGEAVAAVRRLGLRPSLERVEGYEPGIQGFVVSQEPADGSEVQPGGAVCLFIAAPSRTIADTSPPPDVDGGEPEPEVDIESLHVGEPLYADETVELYEIAAPADWSSEPGGAFEESEPLLDDGQPLASDGAQPSGGVWRGPPSSSPRNHLRSPRAGLIARRRARWRSLPRAVRWVALALSACVVLAVLVSVGHQSHSTSRRPSALHRSPSAQAGVVPPVVPPVVPRVRRAVAASRAGRRREAQRRRRTGARRVRSMSRRVRGVPAAPVHTTGPLHTTAPVATPVRASSAPAQPPVESAEEHVIREFGP